MISRAMDPLHCFDFAVAENALGETVLAQKHMRQSVADGYMPIHERLFLSDYLKLNSFEGLLNQELAKKHPSADVGSACSQ